MVPGMAGVVVRRCRHSPARLSRLPVGLSLEARAMTGPALRIVDCLSCGDLRRVLRIGARGAFRARSEK
jgi:hypothetical protein